MNSQGICFGGSFFTLSAVLFSFLAPFGVSAVCPKQCRCLSFQRWKCVNVSLGDLEGFPSTLRSLTISHLSQGISDSRIPPFHSVRQLEVLHSRIIGITHEFISKFPNLKIVRFRKSTFKCSEKLLPLQNWKHIVSQRLEKLTCSTLDGSSDIGIFAALQKIERGLAQCPARCKCSIYSNDRDDLQFTRMLVNCSHSSLTELPRNLPDSWAIHLDLSYNELTQVSENVIDSLAYRNVMVLDLAHNSIHTLNFSLNSALKHISMLDLSYNNLKKLPDFLFGKHSLYDNHHHVMLKGNPWECNCQNAKKFLIVATLHAYTIEDYDHITCGGDLNGMHPSSKGLLSNVCIISSVAWGMPYLYILQALATIFIIYYTRKIICICQSIHKTGESRIAVHIFLQRT